MKRLLVTGASGLLGLNLALQMTDAYEVTGVVHENGLTNVPFRVLAADLAAEDVAERLLDVVEPQALIHCAAMANIDACEHQPERAWAVNAQLPGHLARLAAQRGVRMVHLSTDAVFDGQRGGYVESDEPNPLSVYARTKLDGERLVLEANPQAVVARVNFYGWSLGGQRSLAEFFVNNLSAAKTVNGFTDVMFCPLMVNDLADLLLKLAEAEELSGIYHVVSSERLSKYEFGVSLARRFGLDAGLIRPVSVMEGGLTARRSPRLDLNVDRLTAALGTPPPGLHSGLERFYTQSVQGYPQYIRSLRSGASTA